jgi:hypothetical protein
MKKYPFKVRATHFFYDGDDYTRGRIVHLTFKEAKRHWGILEIIDPKFRKDIAEQFIQEYNGARRAILLMHATRYGLVKEVREQMLGEKV